MWQYFICLPLKILKRFGHSMKPNWLPSKTKFNYSPKPKLRSYLDAVFGNKSSPKFTDYCDKYTSNDVATPWHSRDRVFPPTTSKSKCCTLITFGIYGENVNFNRKVLIAGIIPKIVYFNNLMITITL